MTVCFPLLAAVFLPVASGFAPVEGEWRSYAAVSVVGDKVTESPDGSVLIAPGSRQLYAVQVPVTASGWTLDWKSDGRVKIRMILLGNAESLKLSDTVQWDDEGDKVPDGYVARSRNLTAWVLRFSADVGWPLFWPYTSGLFFIEVSPSGHEPVRFGELKFRCRAMRNPPPVADDRVGREFSVTGKVGAVDIVHSAGRQPKGAPDTLAGWLYVYADGTTACAFATLRWNCGVLNQGDIEDRKGPDSTWFGPPNFDWGEALYEPANASGTHWTSWYRWRFVNPHPEKTVVKLQMFRQPDDSREYRIKDVTPIAAEDFVLSVVEPAKAVLVSGEPTGVNVYEYRPVVPGSAKDRRTIRAEKSDRVSIAVGAATMRREGVFAAAATTISVAADKDVSPGAVTLTAGAARSSRLSLMPARRGDERPFYYTMICSGQEPYGDYDRMSRCGFDEVKVHMTWKVDAKGKWSDDGWGERVERIRRAGMDVALRNVFHKEFEGKILPLYRYADGESTEYKHPWIHDTTDPFYREKLVDYYAFIGRFCAKHPSVKGINCGYGAKRGIALPGDVKNGRAPTVFWNDNMLARFREWLRQHGKDDSAVAGPQAILDDGRLFEDYARWNEEVGSVLIRDIAKAIRKGSDRPHLTFNVNFHPVENKLSGQTFAEYLRVGMKYGPGSLFHETSERYALSFVKWMAAARTCGLVYGDECCQNPPTHEHAALAYMWMGMMQCYEANYCQWFGGRPATENVAQFKAYHRMLIDAEYLPDPVCLAISFETGFDEIAETAKHPLHTVTMSHYGLANALRQLNVNADRYMIDEFPEKDAAVTSKILIDDIVRAMPKDFGRRIEAFVRNGGTYLASEETDKLNRYAFFKTLGVTDLNALEVKGDAVRYSEVPVGKGRLVILRGTWAHGWELNMPDAECVELRSLLTRLGGFVPKVTSSVANVSVTPYRAKDGSVLVSAINTACVDRKVDVGLSKSLFSVRPCIRDLGTGEVLSASESDGYWIVATTVPHLNATMLKVK